MLPVKHVIGPGSGHAEWAKERTGNPRNKGLTVSLEPGRSNWTIDPKTGNPPKGTARQISNVVQVCAQCHARRSQISDNYHAGAPFMDAYLPSLLEDSLYYPDGQIKEEDYEYASFLQSKMFQQGVECSHCHDSHTLRLLAPENVICSQCHTPAKYDSPAHHFHKTASAGAHCVECHMPKQFYMVVDGRRDHSIRIPRPDLSETLGTPNACNQCHQDKSTKWALKSAEKWWKLSKRGPDYGEVFHDARNYRSGAERNLVRLAQDKSLPDIVRATAIAETRQHAGMLSLNAIATMIHEEDPLIRLAALEALESATPEARWQIGSGLLKDPSLAVRVRAATILGDIPQQGLTPEQTAMLQAAREDFLRAQNFSADRPEAHMNRGNLFVQQGKLQEAEAEYQKALRLQPSMIQGHVNLADLYRGMNHEEEAERTLRKALGIEPDNPEAEHALGLALVRQGRTAEALPLLAEAVKHSERNPRYVYVYAVALNSAGRAKQAISALESGRVRFPDYRDFLIALIQFCRDAGQLQSARNYAQELVLSSPGDSAALALQRELEAANQH